MGSMQMPTEKVWDRHEIKAEIERQGRMVPSSGTLAG